VLCCRQGTDCCVCLTRHGWTGAECVASLSLSASDCYLFIVICCASTGNEVRAGVGSRITSKGSRSRCQGHLTRSTSPLKKDPGASLRDAEAFRFALPYPKRCLFIREPNGARIRVRRLGVRGIRIRAYVRNSHPDTLASLSSSSSSSQHRSPSSPQTPRFAMPQAARPCGCNCMHHGTALLQKWSTSEQVSPLFACAAELLSPHYPVHMQDVRRWRLSCSLAITASLRGSLLLLLSCGALLAALGTDRLNVCIAGPPRLVRLKGAWRPSRCAVAPSYNKDYCCGRIALHRSTNR
jgi:hypothetical protein